MERIEVKPKSYPTNLLQRDWTKRKCFLRRNIAEHMDLVYDMEVREDDVWVVTLPKCGTTWMQELVWLVLNDYDFETAKQEHLEVRSPFIEFAFFCPEDGKVSLRHIEELKSPRLIKSHLPLPLLPAQLWQKKPKLIYVFRNPKDALVSFHYHSRFFGMEMDKTCEESVRDYIDNSSKQMLQFEHVTEFYALRHEPWVYYTSFERMKLNLRQVITDVVQFLNKSINEEQMRQMLQHLSFESMKANPKTNHVWEQERYLRFHNFEKQDDSKFIRSGQMGGYKKDLSPDLIAKCEKWIEEELKSHNLTLNQLLLLDEDQVI